LVWLAWLVLYQTKHSWKWLLKVWFLWGSFNFSVSKSVVPQSHGQSLLNKNIIHKTLLHMCAIYYILNIKDVFWSFHIDKIKTVRKNLFKLGMLLEYDNRNILRERNLGVTVLTSELNCCWNVVRMLLSCCYIVGILFINRWRWSHYWGSY
jgi:hypothetical protein